MSLITRCPACETLFKVVPDQLRISEGWVRCGQCDEVFDASFHLLPTLPQGDAPEVLQTASTEIEDMPDVSVNGASLPVDTDPDIDDIEDIDGSAVAAANHGPVPAALAENDGTDSLSSEASRYGTAAIASIDPGPRPDPDPDPNSDADPVAAVSSDSPEPDLTAESGKVSFLQDRGAGSIWHKPLMRATMGFMSIALLLGLAGQIMFHERDRIAASEPELKPTLQAACRLLGCILAPLKRIESIVIESSSFARIRGDSYRLSFAIKNTAVTQLAVPALELTLTDSLDQPVVRRVFLPEELGVKTDTLAAGVEWPASLTVSVKAADEVERVAGYRLLAFYP